MADQSTPLVSIVFTSYNHETFLRQALESILNQTFTDFELIIVDDCSSDSSPQILKEYADDPRIKLHLLEKNTGSYVKSSNYGGRQAKGKYLLFAQCDDYADPEQVERLVGVLEDNESVGVAYSRSNLVDEHSQVFADDFKGREKKFRDRCKEDTLLKSHEMRRFFAHSCVLPNLSAGILRRSLYEKVGGLPEKYFLAADWAFWMDLAEISDFYYITKPLNNFRQHNTTIRNTIKVQRQILEIFDIFYAHIKTYNLSGSEARAFRVGAGGVWFEYVLNGFSPWIKCFPAVLRKTFKHDKLNWWFLFVGVWVFGKELIIKKTGA